MAIWLNYHLRGCYLLSVGLRIMDDTARPMRLRSLLLTALMLTTSLAMVFAAPVTADSGRTTGNEEVQVSITGGDEYFDRDSQFTVSVTSSNLDSATEYTLDWHLCTTQLEWIWSADGNDYETYICQSDASNSDASLSGTIDLGSGNNAVQYLPSPLKTRVSLKKHKILTELGS